MRIGLIGIGAGAAAALLFASVTSGSLLAMVLFYLAPLPMMIAGIGWSHWAALGGAAFGALSLGYAFSPLFFFAFLVIAGLPAWWLSYLSMLARPSEAGTLEWYPPGRLVIWATAAAILVILVSLPSLGFDAESFRAGLRHNLAQLLQAKIGAASDGPLVIQGVAHPQRLIDFLVEALPPAAAVVATLVNVLNLWLAARIVKLSGLLRRPWPPLAEMYFPLPVAAALALTVVLSFAGGMLGILAGAASASLLIAYGILGFAVLHAITRGMDARAFLLGGAYAAVLVFGWPMLALCLLGLVETLFGLRGRVARRRGPPAPT